MTVLDPLVEKVAKVLVPEAWVIRKNMDPQKQAFRREKARDKARAVIAVVKHELRIDV